MKRTNVHAKTKRMRLFFRLKIDSIKKIHPKGPIQNQLLSLNIHTI